MTFSSLTIIALYPNGKRQEFRLPEGETSFGRAWDNDLVLNDPYVSRQHGTFIMAEGSLRVAASSSTNPIIVDGQRIEGEEPHPLGAGSVLVIGRLKLTVDETEPGSDVMAEIKVSYEKAGLPCPPVPAHLVPQLTIRGEWFYSSRDVPYLYNLGPRLLRELEQDLFVDDFILFGHGGHGANSWAQSYYLVDRKLAVFLEVGWGGAYMDKQRCTNRFRDAIEALEGLLAAADEALATRAPGDRMIVYASDLRVASWWCPDRHSERREVADPVVADTIARALDWIRSGSG